jgi:N-dimethylarginine dimethylaminohydrolase
MTVFLMCRPDYYGIEYEINPWMSIQRNADTILATKQWQDLYQTILQCGADVQLLPPVAGCPDMVFTANAGLLEQHQILLSQFKHPERQNETPYYQAWFQKAGYEIVNSHKSSLFFEGAGDALFTGDTLFCGYGFRTDREFYETTPYFKHKNIVYCELTDPHFYHLDTCFCPINDHQAIWYPQAFTLETQKRMQEAIELFAVDKTEADRFACNAVVIDQKIILPTGCEKISAQLKQLGFTVHACDMSEFLKAGGACKCLTLQLTD